MGRPACTVRPAMAADTATLERFAAGLQEFERPLDPGLMPGATMVEMGYVAAMQADVAEGAGLTLIAEQGGVAVGYGHCLVQIDKDASLYPERRRHLFVSDLFVAEEARSQGVGAALLRAMEEHAKAQGLHRMLISVHAANRPAADLYRRFGFEDYELYLQKMLRDGA